MRFGQFHGVVHAAASTANRNARLVNTRLYTEELVCGLEVARPLSFNCFITSGDAPPGYRGPPLSPNPRLSIVRALIPFSASFLATGSQDLRVVLHMCSNNTPGPDCAAAKNVAR